MKTLVYDTAGTCSRQIVIAIDDNDVVQEVRFMGGCAGNTVGVAQLVRGMKASEVIERLKGIQCGMKGTSCPDQLAKALQDAIK